MTVRYTPLLPRLACACDEPAPWTRVPPREPPKRRRADTGDIRPGSSIVADLELVATDGRLYTAVGAQALEHVRRGAGPEQLAELMGKPGHRGWMAMHSHYAAHIAAGPIANGS